MRYKYKSALLVGMMATLMIVSLFAIPTLPVSRADTPQKVNDTTARAYWWNITNTSVKITPDDYDGAIYLEVANLNITNASVIFEGFGNISVMKMNITENGSVVFVNNTQLNFCEVYAYNYTSITVINTTELLVDDAIYIENNVSVEIRDTSLVSDESIIISALEYTTPLGITFCDTQNSTVKFDGVKITHGDIKLNKLSSLKEFDIVNTTWIMNATPVIGTYHSIGFSKINQVNIVNSVIQSDYNMTNMTFGSISKGIKIVESLTIEDSEFVNVHITTVARDLKIKNTKFSSPEIFTNGKNMAIEWYAVEINGFDGMTATISGCEFHNLTYALALWPYGNNTQVYNIEGNNFHNILGGIMMYNFDPYNTTFNTTIKITANIFEEVGKYLYLADYLDNFNPIAIGFIAINDTMPDVIIAKNKFVRSFGTLMIVGDGADKVPVIKNNYFRDWTINMMFNFTDPDNITIDLTENWWYRTNLSKNLSNFNAVHIDCVDDAETYFEDAIMNDTIYDLLTNTNVSTSIKLTPYNYYPMSAITITLHKGWNLIGLPFKADYNLTELFANEDIYIIVWREASGRYDVAVRDIAVQYEFPETWTSLYIFATNNTTITIENRLHDDGNKLALAHGWNIIPCMLVRDGDNFYEILNNSGISLVVVRNIEVEGNNTTISYQAVLLNETTPLNETLTAHYNMGEAIYVFVEETDGVTVKTQEYGFWELFPDESVPY